jgi:RNA polymerase sigma-70 factor (ECF subfamily)
VHEPEPDVVRAAAAGNTRALEELVRAYQAPVWRFLRHLLGDDELAEDVAQEAFVRMYRRLPGFEYRSKFSTWLFQIARNAGLDAARGRTRHLRLMASAPTPAPPRDPAASAEIGSALASLTPKLREALLLVEVLGLTYREAATVLGAPEGTVKSRVAAGREQLVRWMGEGRTGEV